MNRLLGIAAAIACLVSMGMAAAPVSAASPVAVVHGDHLGARVFPDDFFTTADPAQVTGLRLNFRGNGVDYPACNDSNYSICDAYVMLDHLDGFDIQPRVSVPLTGAVDLASVDDSSVFITDDAGHFVSGIRQVVFDPASNQLAGISDKQLKESTRYHVRVTSRLKDSAGNAVNVGAAICDVGFTTRTASSNLVNIRKSMDLPVSDPSSAYVLAGFPGATSSTASRKASFVQGNVTTVFNAAMVLPSVSSSVPGTPGMVRTDQQRTNPADPMYKAASAVPNLIPPGFAGFFAFGSFLSPRYQYASASGHQDNPYGVGDGRTDGEIPPVPTTQTPVPQGVDRLGVIVVTPDPTRFPPPWPAAIYGPGFTRSKYDIFVTADYNANLGVATLATDPAGHTFGPDSTTTVNTVDGTATTFKSFGRGRDLNGDGIIADGLNDGVSPTAHRQPDGSYRPSHKPLDALQSGLTQTVVDNMALVRSIQAGMDIPGVGSDVFKGKPVMYYGLSFGGIYGTMLMGTDPMLHQGLLNVPGGPIVDIARLSGFRGNIEASLKVGRPNLLNGGPGLNGFTEDLPLRNDPPMVMTHKGSELLQELFAQTNWYDRSGSPETFAPRIRLRPDPAWASNPKNVVFQTAYGDGTVPNPTAGNLYRAGELFDRVVYYRNDKTPTYSSDPHGWLADPTLAGRTSGEQQLGIFLATGTLVNTNPAWLETTIAIDNNLACLHYADPQTGVVANRQPFPTSGDCTAVLDHGPVPADAAVLTGCGAVVSANAGTTLVGGLANTAAPAGAAGATAAVAFLLAAAGRERRRRRAAATSTVPGRLPGADCSSAGPLCRH